MQSEPSAPDLNHDPAQDPRPLQLSRACAAVQIPSGASMTLPAGTEFYLTQTLGGSYTVRTQLGLFRLGPDDADALGLTTPAGSPAPEKAAPPTAGPAEPVSEKMVWDTLKTCYDPEIPVNIVDLGLVYDLVVDESDPGKRRVGVKMTLTAPGCGMGTVIAQDAEQKLLALPGVDDAQVEVVWDPPWHPSMISAEGKRVLGLE